MLMKTLLGVSLLTVTMASQAAIITYATEAQAGNRYMTSYVIKPTAGESPVDEFTIFFDYNSYTGLMLESSPAGFDPLVIQPDTAIPDDGYFDALALRGGIATGSEQGGFSVSYAYSGTGMPGSQRFDIVDSVTFQTISTGFTTSEDVTSPGEVPEPASLALVCIGLAGAFSTKRSAHARDQASSVKG